MIYRQIEKLQKVVNTLLGLCGIDADKAESEAVDLPRISRQEQLGIMILKAQDGVLEERYQRRMEKWLLCDQAAMRYYVDFQSLTAMLSMHFHPERLTLNSLHQQTLATQ